MTGNFKEIKEGESIISTDLVINKKRIRLSQFMENKREKFRGKDGKMYKGRRRKFNRRRGSKYKNRGTRKNGNRGRRGGEM